MITNQKDYTVEELLGSKARIKILKILAIHDELSITSIIKRAKLNHSNVVKHLNYLKGVNLIQEKNFGRIRIYRYKTENLKARSLKKFIEIWEGSF
jgi:DNA-binding transcriptional ArsR family regulator